MFSDIFQILTFSCLYPIIWQSFQVVRSSENSLCVEELDAVCREVKFNVHLLSRIGLLLDHHSQFEQTLPRRQRGY
jgi:hypothetical protein